MVLTPSWIVLIFVWAFGSSICYTLILPPVIEHAKTAVQRSIAKALCVFLSAIVIAALPIFWVLRGIIHKEE